MRIRGGRRGGDGRKNKKRRWKKENIRRRKRRRWEKENMRRRRSEGDRGMRI
jgi:hypothetical protein